MKGVGQLLGQRGPKSGAVSSRFSPAPPRTLHHGQTHRRIHRVPGDGAMAPGAPHCPRPEYKEGRPRANAGGKPVVFGKICGRRASGDPLTTEKKNCEYPIRPSSPKPIVPCPVRRRLEGNRRRLEGNRRRLEGDRRRLEGDRRRLEGDRRRLEGNDRKSNWLP